MIVISKRIHSVARGQRFFILTAARAQQILAIYTGFIFVAVYRRVYFIKTLHGPCLKQARGRKLVAGPFNDVLP